MGFLIDELIRHQGNIKINDSLRMAEAVRMGNVGISGKKGAKAYTDWFNKQRAGINTEVTQEKKIETYFDKLKKEASKPLTLFQKFKRGR